MTEENLEDSAVSVARSRWLDANERASSLEAELFQPGSGYGDLDARIADMHRLESSRAEAERLFREYQDLVRRYNQSEVLKLQQFQRSATMTYRWDETWHRLREWTNGQAPSERLAAQILVDSGYVGVDPSHPLGGKDGAKDAVCERDGERWIMAVYFPRGQQDFARIQAKFRDDLLGVAKNNAAGIVFVTNQELRLDERETLQKAAGSCKLDLFHLERVTLVLDKPIMSGIRKQFLGLFSVTGQYALNI